MRLLHRTTRSVSLTDAGLRLLERLRPAIDQIAGALEDLNQERSRPFGRLRIYATHMAAAAVIAPVWETLPVDLPGGPPRAPGRRGARRHRGEGIRRRHRTAGPGGGRHDRRPGDGTDESGRGRRAVLLRAAAAAPRTPDDLARHSCVQYRRGADGAVFEWPFERNGKSRKISVDGRVMVNDPDLAVRAAVDGLGIAYTIEALAEPFLRSGQLVRVLEDWSPSFEGLFLYYPGHRQVPAALRALIDMIRAARDSPPAKGLVENPFAAD